MDLNKLVGDTKPEDIQKLIALLQAVVGSSESEEESDNKIIKKSPIKTKTRTKNRHNNEESNHNKFLDMQEKNMFKEDTAFQKRVSKYPPVPRNRPYKPITVKCRVCGETQDISPTLVDSVDRYKCNNCSGAAG